MTLLPDLSTLAWAALAASAVLVGFSRRHCRASTPWAVAIFAAVLPAKPSTGALLLLLIRGHVCAVDLISRARALAHADPHAPAVLVGLALGRVPRSRDSSAA
ncbi:hypothetical protein QJS66_19065 [Kocuria rhizophila]|nr:hypothetical protein QJS66_19065 [Kocuria rhizophila]